MPQSHTWSDIFIDGPFEAISRVVGPEITFPEITEEGFPGVGGSQRCEAATGEIQGQAQVGLGL